MHPQRRSMVWINVLGGSAILASYAYGIASNPLTRGDVWGGVPETLRPLYTITMLLAAAGYFAFGYFVFFKVDPDEARIGDRFGFGAFNALYALILVLLGVYVLAFIVLEWRSLAEGSVDSQWVQRHGSEGARSTR